MIQIASYLSNLFFVKFFLSVQENSGSGFDVASGFDSCSMSLGIRLLLMKFPRRPGARCNRVARPDGGGLFHGGRGPAWEEREVLVVGTAVSGHRAEDACPLAGGGGDDRLVPELGFSLQKQSQRPDFERCIDCAAMCSAVVIGNGPTRQLSRRSSRFASGSRTRGRTLHLCGRPHHLISPEPKILLPLLVEPRVSGKGKGDPHCTLR